MSHPTRVTDPRHPTKQPNTARAEAALLADLANSEAAAMPLVRLGQGQYAQDVHAGPGMTLFSRKAAAPAIEVVKPCPYCKLAMEWLPSQRAERDTGRSGNPGDWYCAPCGHCEQAPEPHSD